MHMETVLRAPRWFYVAEQETRYMRPRESRLIAAAVCSGAL